MTQATWVQTRCVPEPSGPSLRRRPFPGLSLSPWGSPVCQPIGQGTPALFLFSARHPCGFREHSELVGLDLTRKNDHVLHFPETHGER